MAVAHLQYHIYHDWARGDSQLGSFSGTVPTPSATELNVKELPSEWVGNTSAEIIFHLFNRSTEFALDCTGITPALKARPTGQSAIAPLSIAGTPTVGGAANNEITCIVPRNTIPPGWASFPSTRIYLELDEGATIYSRAWQDVTVLDLDDDSADVPDVLGDLPITTELVTTTAALDARPGKRTILVDTTGGTFVLTLPAPGTYDGQAIEILHIAGTADCTIAPNGGTVNAVAGNFAMEAGDSVDLREWSSNWLMRNPTLVMI